MGNAVLKALVRVFLPLIAFVLAVILIVALVKMLCRTENEKSVIESTERIKEKRELEETPVETYFSNSF